MVLTELVELVDLRVLMVLMVLTALLLLLYTEELLASQPHLQELATHLADGIHSVPTDSDLPVWECVGNHPGEWAVGMGNHLLVSATFWTKPDSTYIDGNKIFTGVRLTLTHLKSKDVL